MSESRRDLGPLQDVMSAALAAYARWGKFAPIQKLEIVSLLQAMVQVETARQSRATAQLGNAWSDLHQPVTDEPDRH